MKVLLHSQKEYESKIRYLEEKLERSLKKNIESSKEKKYLRKRLKELAASRDGWKSKNRSKGQIIKALRKGRDGRRAAKRHHYSLWLVVLCVKLRVVAGCSYRGIAKVLAVLCACHVLRCPKLPCANTVENWVSKMGYHCIGNAGEGLPRREACLIIDESVKQGNERVLLLLVTPWQKEGGGPLCYADTMVCHLGGSTSWTGEKIRAVAEKAARRGGFEIKGVLSDEDSKLLKAARLMGLPHVPDIGHAVASCLRKAFEKNAGYKGLVKLITSLQARAVNQDLSYLRPPRQRVKARFMNQKGFVEWGLAMLDNFDRLNEKERSFFAGLPSHRPVLETLRACIETGEKVSEVLKSKGLTKATVTEAGQIMEGQADKGGPGARFLDHLGCYLDRYRLFLENRDGVYNASSDIIESMFGRHKNIGASDTLVGVTQMDLELAVYCLSDGDIPLSAQAGLESVFMSDLKVWREEHSSGNQALRRKNLLKKRTGF